MCTDAEFERSSPTKRQRKLNANLSLHIPEVEYKVIPLGQPTLPSKDSQKTKLTGQLTEATALGEPCETVRYDSRCSPILHSSSQKDSKRSKNVSFDDHLNHYAGHGSSASGGEALRSGPDHFQTEIDKILNQYNSHAVIVPLCMSKTSQASGSSGLTQQMRCSETVQPAVQPSSRGVQQKRLQSICRKLGEPETGGLDTPSRDLDLKSAVTGRFKLLSKKDTLLSLGKRLHHQLREKKTPKGKRTGDAGEPETSALSVFLEDYPLLMMKEQARAAKRASGHTGEEDPLQRMIKDHVQQKMASNPNYERLAANSRLSSQSESERPKHRKLNPFNNFKQQRFNNGSLEFVPHQNNESPQFNISKTSCNA